MKLLKDILYKSGLIEIQGSNNTAVENICFDSREVTRLSCFIAVKGTVTDGHAYIDEVIKKGAVAIICEQFPANLVDGVSYVKVANTQKALGNIAANFYDHPSKEIKLIGITGTNGKTTVASGLYNLFTQLDTKCGLISTVKIVIDKEVLPATHTTPDAISLNRTLRNMVNKKCVFCFMEVSSHALDQGRVESIEFKGAVFTNITHDHLDYHNTFDHYLKSKKILFDGLKENAFALSNADDKNGKIMLQNCKANKHYYALRNVADFKTRIIENSIAGLQLSIDHTEVWAQFIGEFNAYNLTAIYGTAVLLGIDKMNALTTLSTLVPVDGRFEIVKGPNGITGIVDYAHTPDALQNVLNTIRDIVKKEQKVITIVGCGGNRDTTKRPVMAKVAAGLSDKVILTSDNPRNEDPEQILKEMKAGLDLDDLIKTVMLTDRRQAIEAGCKMAGPQDVILIAGKGHETYQEIQGVRHHFDDVEELTNAFKKI
jgi:UDP-N-acetylmuramoyl-L-alanyl-D-glutamate--2,6-diaminopimelate ligase